MLVAPAGQHHAAHIHPDAAECIDQTQYIGVVGDAQVAANLAFFNVIGIDGHHQLRLILQVEQHGYLAVRLETRQHTRCMKIVKQLSAQFQIELTAECGNAAANVIRLHPCIKIMIESRTHDGPPLLIINRIIIPFPLWRNKGKNKRNASFLQHRARCPPTVPHGQTWVSSGALRPA